MIIARAEDNKGKPILLLGLSHENINRLMKGMPIKLSSQKNPGVPDGWTIAIMYTMTEADIYAKLCAAAKITKDTEVKIDPRLQS